MDKLIFAVDGGEDVLLRKFHVLGYVEIGATTALSYLYAAEDENAATAQLIALGFTKES